MTTVHVLRIGSNGEVDPYVERLFSTWVLANAYVANWCRENWDDEPRFSDRVMPKNDQDLIEQWFASDDWRTIVPVEVDED